MRLGPKLVSYRHWLDAQASPPLVLSHGLVDFAMVHAAERHGEFVAHLAAQRPGLCEPQMMGVGRLAPAHHTRLRDKLAVALVTQSARSGHDGMLFEISDRCGVQGSGL